MKKINFTKAFFPNSFTAFNLLSGFFSIIFAAQNELILSAIFIFVAVFFDATDGMIARLFKTSSRLGVELDSLADVVSFGAAPAILMYYSFLIKYETIGIVLASIYLIFGAFRLARFNALLESITEKPDFNGLPIPMAAMTIASYIILHKPNPFLFHPYDKVAIAIMLFVSVLMVSDLKYFSLAKFPKLRNSAQISISLGLLVFLISFFISNGETVFYFFAFLVLSGFFNSKIEKYLFDPKKIRN